MTSRPGDGGLFPVSCASPCNLALDIAPLGGITFRTGPPSELLRVPEGMAGFAQASALVRAEDVQNL